MWTGGRVLPPSTPVPQPVRGARVGDGRHSRLLPPTTPAGGGGGAGARTIAALTHPREGGRDAAAAAPRPSLPARPAPVLVAATLFPAEWSALLVAARLFRVFIPRTAIPTWAAPGFWVPHLHLPPRRLFRLHPHHLLSAPQPAPFLSSSWAPCRHEPQLVLRGRGGRRTGGGRRSCRHLPYPRRRLPSPCLGVCARLPKWRRRRRPTCQLVWPAGSRSAGGGAGRRGAAATVRKHRSH